ncbi:carbohydrate kinase [Rhodobacterales bacterium]|nr:carbohydrate kinase [Rhodobacterales bacterium]
MAGPRHVGVIDIGKTNAKVAVVDLESEREIGVLTRANTVLAGPPYPHFDLEGHWAFICDALARLHAAHGIEAISVTTHGASAVLLDKDGNPAAPMLDYEHGGPDALAARYDAIRPEFAETGSPRLPMGLNLGAQLHWQLATDPGLLERTATVLTYPQYWGYLLTGVLANEATSLGCHTDLWAPFSDTWSSLVGRLGLADRMAPVRKAGDRLGSILPAIADRTGLPEGVPVACGIHDSNASLYPHLLRRNAPFSVVSTGTWVIVLAVGGGKADLDPARDTLINVDAFGSPVPSARFMGGREFEIICDGHGREWSDRDVTSVLNQGAMLLPAVDPRSGPFQGRRQRWTVPETGLSEGERFVALSCYLALMTRECLSIAGAAGPVVVEGPFARNPLYRRMLQAASGCPVVAEENSLTGTAIGAALLHASAEQHPGTAAGDTGSTSDADSGFADYASRWRDLIG